MSQSKLPNPIVGRATIMINSAPDAVFAYIGHDFFVNYPKWSPEVVELEPLSSGPIQLGTMVRQVRVDQRRRIETRFRVTAFDDGRCLRFAGVPDPFVCTYELQRAAAPNSTSLTFTFEGFELRGYMVPFEKLIRVVVQDGAARTVRNVKRLVERRRPAPVTVGVGQPCATGDKK